MQDPSEIDQLQVDGAISRLSYVGDAITLTRHRIEGKVPLIGFTGAPVSKPYNSDHPIIQYVFALKCNSLVLFKCCFVTYLLADDKSIKTKQLFNNYS